MPRKTQLARAREHAEALPGALVRISLQDTGVGIADDALARLFQPFERLGQDRTTIPGTGLGLVIARGLIEAMGGRLTVTSRPGVGTTVQLVLKAG